jgi:hypothetical protein
MPGTGLGIFWVDFLCRPFFRGMLHQPELVVLFIFLIYGYIAYKLVKSAYLSDHN